VFGLVVVLRTKSLTGPPWGPREFSAYSAGFAGCPTHCHSLDLRGLILPSYTTPWDDARAMTEVVCTYQTTALARSEGSELGNQVARSMINDASKRTTMTDHGRLWIDTAFPNVVIRQSISAS
jgi:hypothetical protein